MLNIIFMNSINLGALGFILCLVVCFVLMLKNNKMEVIYFKKAFKKSFVCFLFCMVSGISIQLLISPFLFQ